MDSRSDSCQVKKEGFFPLQAAVSLCREMLHLCSGVSLSSWVYSYAAELRGLYLGRWVLFSPSYSTVPDL